LYWDNSLLGNWPQDWRGNSFSDNVGSFGMAWASQPVNISTVATVVVDSTSNAVPNIRVYLFDNFGNFVTNSSYVVLRSVVEGSDHCFETPYSIAGVSKGNTWRGYAEFAELTATCYPNGDLTSSFSVELSFDAESAGSPSAVKVATTQLWTFSTCVSGQTLKGGSCVTCPRGKCSLQGAPLLEGMSKAVYTQEQLQSLGTCKAMPSNADHSKTFGDQLYLLPGYWRISPQAYQPLHCPADIAACRGGNLTGDSSCLEGYGGPMCNVCKDGYYLSSSSNSCTSCEGVGLSGLIIFPVVVILLVLIYVFFKARIIALAMMFKESNMLNKIKIVYVLCQVRYELAALSRVGLSLLFSLQC